jgi:predicted small lipoprotein YifL
MRITYPLAVLAGLLALAACGKKKPEEAPVENDVVAAPENVPVAPPPMPEVPVETNAAKAPENRVAPPEISDEQQMQDDAAATGMTSKLPDDAGTTSTPSGAGGGGQ